MENVEADEAAYRDAADYEETCRLEEEAARDAYERSFV